MKKLTAFFLLSCLAASASANAPSREMKPCSEQNGSLPCLMAPAGPPDITALPNGASVAIQSDQLTISWRGPASSVRILGEAQGLPQLPVVAPELRQLTVRVPDAGKLKLRLNFLATGTDGKSLPLQTVSVIGTAAALDLPRSQAGRKEVLTLNDGRFERKVNVWYPPGFVAGRSYPIIYAADGASHADASLLAGEVASGTLPSFMVVGIEDCSTLAGDPRCRGREYMDAPTNAGGSPEDFARAEQFLIQTVMPRIEQQFREKIKRDQRAIAGASSGADWAAAMALRHPELFSAAFVMSPAQGSYRTISRTPEARFFIIAGTLERPNVRAAHCLGGAIHSAGGRATLQILPSGHSTSMWEGAFYQNSRQWLLGIRDNTPPAPPLEKDCYRFAD